MKEAKILIAEDDEIMRVTLSDRLSRNEWRVDEAKDGREALAKIHQQKYHVVISDIRMPHASGFKLLEELQQVAPNTDVIFMTAYGSINDAVACLKNGATDYLLKPFDMDDLVIRVERLLENQTLKTRYLSLEECCQKFRHPIIGKSKVMQNLLAIIKQIAASDATVLISGESGTGKELVAAAIHYSSNRADGPYIRVNCAAIPENLIESELFGHEKGAFTGADARKLGRFEMADCGTILLDEIGDMPLHLQTKLLRVLQEREIERLGGQHSIKVDVRVLCATAKNLAEEVQKGNFREDLFYRLQVIPVIVPSLRERKEDIPLLCEYFMEKLKQTREKPLTLSNDAMAAMMEYEFPGNVRELHNIIERLLVLHPTETVQSWNLPIDIVGSGSQQVENVQLLASAVAQAEKSCIMRAITKTNGKKSEAAQLLGISRKNLWQKLKLYELDL